MPTYQVEELSGDTVVASETVVEGNPMKAVERVAGCPVSPRARQEHWFRVVDEEAAVVHEFSIADAEETRDFSK